MFLSLASFEHINALSQHGVNGNHVRRQDLVVQIRVHRPAAGRKTSCFARCSNSFSRLLE
jgi:hypothetical protein